MPLSVVDVPDSPAVPNRPLDALAEHFPEIAAAPEPELHAILQRARLATSPAGTRLVNVGSQCQHFMLLLEGQVRVHHIAEDGRELSLYRIRPGDICLMSLNSLLHNRPFKACATTETDCQAMQMNGEDFHAAMSVSAAFRNRVLSSVANSVCDMMHTFYDTAFQTLDMRLACLLGRLFERANSTTVHITHQQLAQELGTSREVISRTLKKLEHQGCVRLARGQIRLGEEQPLPGHR